MRILLINEVCGTGSTGRICTDIAESLDRQGHEVKIAYGRDDRVPDAYRKYAVRIGNSLDVMIHALMTRAFDNAGFGSRAATRKFIKWIKQYNPDIIHLHNLHGYYINIELLFEYLKNSNHRVFWTLHDCWAFTGHSAYCDAISCERWENGCYSCPQRDVYPKSWVDHSIKNWTRKKEIFTGVENLTILTPSEWLAGQVKRSFLKEYPVKVIYNGIDTDVFYPHKGAFRKKYGLEQKYLILGVSTVWTKMKGFDDFLRLADLIDESCQIVMVGGMNKHQERQLRPNILHINRTESKQEMAEIFSECDIFFNATYCDTYPTVNLEAVACGTNMVTYDTGGSAESARMYGESVVEKGNVENAWKKMSELICNENARNDVNLGLLDKSIFVAKQEDLYLMAGPNILEN